MMILIVEDEEHIANLVRYNLDKAGFITTIARNGEDALVILNKKPVELVVLDIMLPQMNGLEVCKRIKRNERIASVPIIMLTAKGHEMDRIIGFELGANDYVVKPFSPRELVLRIKAILNYGKSNENVSNILAMDKLEVNISKHKVTVSGKRINLTSMEFKLLSILMKRKGLVQDRDILLQDVWDVDANVTTRTVDTHIKCLRRKLGKMGGFIETVRGIGYRFCEK